MKRDVQMACWLAGALQCHRTSARVFAEHDPAAAAGRGECRQRGLGPNLDLAGAGGAAELLYAVGVHGGAAAPGAQIAAARAERVRSLDADVAGVEREGIAAFDAVPLEGFQEELRHRCIAVVRIEYINVLGLQPGAVVHSPGGAVGPVRHRVPRQARVMSIRKTGSLKEPSWIILASRLRLTCSPANPSYAARDF